jgi:transcriptional regulator with XRE-family HTH domain
MKYKVNEKLGKRIRKARRDRKMTQEELAEKVGLHYTTISRIERGISNSPVQTVGKIAKTLKVKMSDLF